MSEAHDGGETWRDRLRAARNRAGFSQEQLGAAIDKSKSAVQSWESAEGNQPSLDDLERMAAALRTSAAWIAFGAETQPDLRVIESVIIAASRVIDRERIDMTPERRASLYLALYNFIRMSGNGDNIAKRVEAHMRIMRKGAI